MANKAKELAPWEEDQSPDSEAAPWENDERTPATQVTEKAMGPAGSVANDVPEAGLESADPFGGEGRLKRVAKALSYPSGIVSTALANLASLGLKRKPLPQQDLARAFSGDAPAPWELAKTAGIPEGPSLGHIGGVPLSARTLISFLTSAGLDPINKLGDYDYRPVAEQANKMGQQAYNNAFGTVDRSLLKLKNFRDDLTARPFSELVYEKKLLQSGMSPQEMEEALINYKENHLGDAYNELYDTSPAKVTLGENGPPIPQPPKKVVSPILDDTGKPIVSYEPQPSVPGDFQLDPKKFEDTLDRLIKYAKQEPNRPGAERAGNMLLTDAQKGPRSVRDTADLAKSYSDIARSTTDRGDFMNAFSSPSAGKDTAMTISRDLRAVARDAAAEANPEAYERFMELNPQYNILENAEKPFSQLVSREMGKHPVTQVTGALGAGALLAKKSGRAALDYLALLGGKTGARYANSPSGAVRVGNTLRSMGEQNIWDQALRRGLLEKAKQESEQ